MRRKNKEAEICEYTIHNVNYVLNSVEINPHPHPVSAIAGRIKCVVLMDEKGAQQRALKFTFDMKRGRMTDSDIKANCVANSLEALAFDKEFVVAKQSEEDGFRAIENE